MLRHDRVSQYNDRQFECRFSGPERVGMFRNINSRRHVRAWMNSPPIGCRNISLKILEYVCPGIGEETSTVSDFNILSFQLIQGLP